MPSTKDKAAGADETEKGAAKPVTELRWRVGQYVCRENDATRRGVIAEVERAAVKVHWDDGAISYYRLDQGIPLTEAQPPATT
jgi:hypothetical protein